jgi:hypothetical protein
MPAMMYDSNEEGRGSVGSRQQRQASATTNISDNNHHKEYKH